MSDAEVMERLPKLPKAAQLCECGAGLLAPVHDPLSEGSWHLFKAAA
jgi:hypothetical protein